jgi:DsbC/DsbD-like thiol-disulfide interchange protein
MVAMTFATIRAALVPVVVAAATVLPVSAAVSGTSGWDGDQRAGMRVVAGGTKVEDGRTFVRAGVEIRLAPGWKTYWRYPGDSGVPPHFDFARSENVKSVQVAWPAPERISEADGIIIGYRNSVLFPLVIEPKDANAPVTLRLALDYAICEKVCIPVQASAELKIKSGGNAEPAIVAAEKTVPKSQPLGADAPLTIRSVRRDDATKPAKIIVDIAAPDGKPVNVFAEGPTQDWALPVPEKSDGAPAGLQRYVFALDGLPPGASPNGAEIRLTAVAGEQAIETTFRLD